MCLNFSLYFSLGWQVMHIHKTQAWHMFLMHGNITGMEALSRILLSNCPSLWTSFSSPQRWPRKTSSSDGNNLARKMFLFVLLKWLCLTTVCIHHADLVITKFLLSCIKCTYWFLYLLNINPCLIYNWACLISPQQEVQKIFKAKHSMDTEVTKAKVRLFE